MATKAAAEAGKSKTVILTLRERYALIHMLPAKGFERDVRNALPIKVMLYPTPQERVAWKVKKTGAGSGQITWPDDAATAIQMEFSQAQWDTVSKSLRLLNTQEAITEDHLTIWDKFIGPPDAEKD